MRDRDGNARYRNRRELETAGDRQKLYGGITEGLYSDIRLETMRRQNEYQSLTRIMKEQRGQRPAD